MNSVDWVECSYQSPYGEIVSNWRREAGKLEMDVTVPANTTATVAVPITGAGTVTESGKGHRRRGDYQTLAVRSWARNSNELQPGRYVLQSTISP